MFIVFLADQKKIMKSLFFLVAAFISVPYWSQTTVLSEDFSSGSLPASWLIQDVDGQPVNASVNFITSAWTIIEDIDSAGSGSMVITSTSWYDPSGTSDDWLITEPITLGAGGNRVYWDAIAHDGSFADGYEVRWSTHAEVDSFLVNEPLYTSTAETPVWSGSNINLDSAGLSGMTIRLAFRNNSTNQYLLSLDNIHVIIDIPLDVTSFDEQEIRVYPNPTTNLIAIQSNADIYQMNLFDLQGKQLLSATNSRTMHTHQVTTGHYILEVHTSKGIIRKTVVKK